MTFRWNRWNIEHIDRHGVAMDEAEWVIVNAGRGYPRQSTKTSLWSGEKPRPADSCG